MKRAMDYVYLSAVVVRFIAVVLGVACLVAGVGANELRIGKFEVDVTPPLGSPVAYAPARHIDDPLSARGIVLLGAGLSGLFGLPVILHVAMWILAVTSLITLGQRVHSVRTSPGAMDVLKKPSDTDDADAAGAGGEKPEANGS